MRVLWFTNIIMPDLAPLIGRQPEVTGGWMPSLLDALRRRSGIELAVCTMVPGHRGPSRYVVEGVTYYCLPSSGRLATALTPELRRASDEAVTSFRPDVIHVHGTEEVYGLFTALSHDRPAVVSIQGLIHVAARHVQGGIRFGNAIRVGPHGVLVWLRYLLKAQHWKRRGRMELAVLKGNRQFIGRTTWDRAHVLAAHPGAAYHHCWEALRPAFFNHGWTREQCARYTIFCTAAHSPHKGFDVLLEAVDLLRAEFPAIRVRVAGAPWNGAKGFGFYGRYLKSLIEHRGLGDHVTPLPPLGPEGVAQELEHAHAFVLPSFIENSPNSLAEAMVVGTPCIAAFVGGVPSMITDGESGLAFQAGDSAYLAECLRRVFTDTDLANRLSSAAQVVAQERHDPMSVAGTQVAIYGDMVDAAQREVPRTRP